MRQSGVLCAAALVALQENVQKIEGDHKKARTLAGIILFQMHFFVRKEMHSRYDYLTSNPSPFSPCKAETTF